MEDAASLARLVEALRPWLGHLVIVGGWAHRLHRLHALAGAPAEDARRRPGPCTLDRTPKFRWSALLTS
jgi:hypothetical protein